MDLDRFLAFLNAHALPPRGRGECAKHVREALLEAGIDASRHPALAKDWGPTLASTGFAAMSVFGYQPRRGDIVVFQPVAGSPHGHIQAYDGKHWISDFVQTDGFWPQPAYRHAAAKFLPYRNE